MLEQTNGSLEGRVGVVTGSGRGIGRAMARLLAKEGARVVVNDVGAAINGTESSQRPADDVVEEIRRDGGVAVPSYHDVSRLSEAEKLVQAAIDNFGCLDILVNNAAIMRKGSFTSMTEADWDMVMAVNIKGQFCCARAAVPHMIARRYGRIINMSSGAAMDPAAGYANYAAAKAAVLGFTLALSVEVAEHGITVNALMPRAGTRLQDVAKSPESNAPLVAYLASEKASGITGRTFASWIEGGYKLIDSPRVIGSIYKDGPWTVGDLAKAVPEGLLNKYVLRQAVRTQSP